MTIAETFSGLNTLFIDTAPIIYYIEAHPQFGPPFTKEVFDLFLSGRITAFSSVITLTEVLPKPIQAGDNKLARKFAEFLEHGINFNMLEITTSIAEDAGKLRGHYLDLRALDAIQIAAAVHAGADAFVTNDKKLRQVKEIKVVVLADLIAA